MKKESVFLLIFLLSILLVAGCIEETPTTPLDDSTPTTSLDDSKNPQLNNKLDSTHKWNGSEILFIAPVSDIFKFASSNGIAKNEGYSDIADEVTLSFISGGVSAGKYLQPNSVSIIKLKSSKSFTDFKNHKNNRDSNITLKDNYKDYLIYEIFDSTNKTVTNVATKDGFIIIPSSTKIDVKNIIDDSKKFFNENKTLFDLIEVNNDTILIDFINISTTLSGMPNNVGAIPEWMSNVSKMVTSLSNTKDKNGLTKGKAVFEVLNNSESAIQEIQNNLNKDNFKLSNGIAIDKNLIVFDTLSSI